MSNSGSLLEDHFLFWGPLCLFFTWLRIPRFSFFFSMTRKILVISYCFPSFFLILMMVMCLALWTLVVISFGLLVKVLLMLKFLEWSVSLLYRWVTCRMSLNSPATKQLLFSSRSHRCYPESGIPRVSSEISSCIYHNYRCSAWVSSLQKRLIRIGTILRFSYCCLFSLISSS